MVFLAEIFEILVAAIGWLLNNNAPIWFFGAFVVYVIVGAIWRAAGGPE